jgi:hypothetical protein
MRPRTAALQMAFTRTCVPLMGTAVLRRVLNQLLPKQKTTMFGSINLKRPDSVSWIALLVRAA